MSDVNVLSRTQRIIVDAASGTVSVINAGPQGPAGAGAVFSYDVQGGTIGGTQPTFSGDPLFDGYYAYTGNLVYFQINVDFDNITSFGTGQYYLTLPFNTLHSFMVRNGCLTDFSSGDQYSIGGHCENNDNVITLWYTSSNGHDAAFTYNSPVGLDTTDDFHISGWYIKA